VVRPLGIPKIDDDDDVVDRRPPTGTCAGFRSNGVR
jgi:hypothetical protein